jgi:hypothetical protein
MAERISRRTATCAALAAAGSVLIPRPGDLPAHEAEQPAAADCRRCRGLGLVPKTAAKPFVFAEGQAAFRPADAAIGQPSPLCQADGQAARLAAEAVAAAQREHERVLTQHAQWEERLGEKLLLVQTRHAAIHTQLKPADAKRAGEAVEQMTQKLARLAGSLAIVPTRPSGYAQIILWGEPAWRKFREVMEKLYTPEQLGGEWQNAGKGMMYDHIEVPHLYLTPKIVREAPAEYFAVKLAATRQVWVASGGRPPAWLIEGFAGYAQAVVLDSARVFTIYALDRGPKKPVTLADTARGAAAGQFRPWDKLLARELRDFETSDYVQSLAMTAFLFEDQPAKFISFVERLAQGEPAMAALEESYGQTASDLEAACSKWLARR